MNQGLARNRRQQIWPEIPRKLILKGALALLWASPSFGISPCRIPLEVLGGPPPIGEKQMAVLSEAASRLMKESKDRSASRALTQDENRFIRSHEGLDKVSDSDVAGYYGAKLMLTYYLVELNLRRGRAERVVASLDIPALVEEGNQTLQRLLPSTNLKLDLDSDSLRAALQYAFTKPGVETLNHNQILALAVARRLEKGIRDLKSEEALVEMDARRMKLANGHPDEKAQSEIKAIDAEVAAYVRDAEAMLEAEKKLIPMMEPITFDNAKEFRVWAVSQDAAPGCCGHGCAGCLYNVGVRNTNQRLGGDYGPPLLPMPSGTIPTTLGLYQVLSEIKDVFPDPNLITPR